MKYYEIRRLSLFSLEIPTPAHPYFLWKFQRQPSRSSASMAHSGPFGPSRGRLPPPARAAATARPAGLPPLHTPPSVAHPHPVGVESNRRPLPFISPSSNGRPLASTPVTGIDEAPSAAPLHRLSDPIKRRHTPGHFHRTQIRSPLPPSCPEPLVVEFAPPPPPLADARPSEPLHPLAPPRVRIPVLSSCSPRCHGEVPSTGTPA
jgi:hypothetical protein